MFSYVLFNKIIDEKLLLDKEMQYKTKTLTGGCFKLCMCFAVILYLLHS